MADIPGVGAKPAVRAKAGSHIPLSELTFHILLGLAPGAKHGYAILEDVRSTSRGEVSLSTSTLYGAMSRLLDQELIDRIPNDPQSKAGLALPRAELCGRLPRNHPKESDWLSELDGCLLSGADDP